MKKLALSVGIASMTIMLSHCSTMMFGTDSGHPMDGHMEGHQVIHDHRDATRAAPPSSLSRRHQPQPEPEHTVHAAPTERDVQPLSKGLDNIDIMKRNQALEYSRTNDATSWRNPNNGYTYTLTPMKTYYKNDKPCRHYKMTVSMGGNRKVINGNACRNGKGSWS